MSHEIKNVQVQQIDEKCQVCNQGYMRPNGIVQPGNPAQFQHKCTNCNHTQFYGVRYPHTMNQ